MFTITKRFTFEAAHVLPWHKGKCARPHGHSYVLEVDVSSADLTGNGIVADFDDLSAVVDEHVVRAFDHQNLNDFFSNPTAEQMAKHILDVLRTEWANRELNGAVSCVRLWETEKCHATAS